MLLPFAVAFGLLAHALFWGAGLSILAMPRPWRRFWPAVAAVAGFALQALVVWLAAYADLPGTNSYAWPAEAIPLALLLVALWRRTRERASPLADAGGFAALWLAAFAVLALLVLPLVRAAKGLTTVSLGSCDAADYAAGARVFQEFARTDRSGFLGLTAVVRTASASDFYEFWLRINHFTPSALIALNGTIFHCQPYELTGLITMVILAGSLPVVFWLCRAGFGFGAKAAFGLALLYGLSPVTWYAVDQVAIAQLLAAAGIALVTWAGIAMWKGAGGGKCGAVGATSPSPQGGREGDGDIASTSGRTFLRRTPSLGWAFFPLLGVAFALIWSSYNFIIVVCAVPAIGYALGRAVLEGRLRRFPAWLGWMAAPAALAGVIFWDRAAGVVERFQLLGKYDEGWRIPGLSPEGWLGLVHGPTLQAFHAWRAFLAGLAAVLILWPLAQGLRFRRPWAITSLLTAVPPLIGYAYLLWKGARLGTNGSYDAYKLFSVFYPSLLPAFFCWLHPARLVPGWRGGALAASAVIAGFVVRADAAFVQAMSSPPYVVDRPLLAVARADADPEITSLNLRVPDLWDRLWANALLLRKPQYFLTDTYEGRWHTALLGSWDLVGDGVRIILPAGGSVALGPRFSAVRVSSRYYVRASLGPGWYPPERLRRSPDRWRWTGNDAVVEVENPQSGTLRARFRVDGNAAVARRMIVDEDGRPVAEFAVGTLRRPRVSPVFAIPPGRHRFELSPQPPAARVSPTDTRRLAFCVFGLDLQVLPGGQ